MTATTAVATKAPAKPIDTVRMALDRMKPQFAMALPRHLTADRLCRVALTAIQNQPKLLDCDRLSLFSAITTCAQLGLEPDGVLGQAYLVPFKGRVQFIAGYKGLIDLARRSGDVVSIQAKEVRDGDHFDYGFGLVEKLEHKPAAGPRDKAITHFWFKATFKDGGYHWDVMTVDEVNAIRDASEGYRAFKAGRISMTPWDTHYAEMGKKTIIRRNAKFLPLSVQKAAAIEDAVDQGKPARADDLGDVVIEGSATEVEGNGNAGPSPPSSRLEQFAGGNGEAATEPPFNPTAYIAAYLEELKQAPEVAIVDAMMARDQDKWAKLSAGQRNNLTLQSKQRQAALKGEGA